MLTRSNIYMIAVLIFLLVFGINVSDAQASKGYSTMNKGNVRINSYKNISSSPSYLKFKFKDNQNGEVIVSVIENSELGYALAGVYYENKFLGSPKLKMPENFNEFINSDYLKFLIEKEGGKEIVNLDDFPRNSKSKHHISNEDIRSLILKSSYRNEITFKDLGVTSANDLLSKYFSCDKNTCSLRKEYSKFNLDRAFIGLLIDQGFCVQRGDLVPILMVQTD